MNYRQAIKNVEGAQVALFTVLQALEGAERRKGIRAALNAGIPAVRLAEGLGISRSRLYQLRDHREQS